MNRFYTFIIHFILNEPRKLLSKTAFRYLYWVRRYSTSKLSIKKSAKFGVFFRKTPTYIILSSIDVSWPIFTKFSLMDRYFKDIDCNVNSIFVQLFLWSARSDKVDLFLKFCKLWPKISQIAKLENRQIFFCSMALCIAYKTVKSFKSPAISMSRKAKKLKNCIFSGFFPVLGSRPDLPYLKFPNIIFFSKELL